MQGTCKLQYLMLVPDILAITLATPVDSKGDSRQ
jgi:hypothetical protein